jgi:hypothetical protein
MHSYKVQGTDWNWTVEDCNKFLEINFSALQHALESDNKQSILELEKLIAQKMKIKRELIRLLTPVIINNDEVLEDEFWVKKLVGLSYYKPDFKFSSIMEWLKDKKIEIKYNDKKTYFEIYDFNNLAPKAQPKIRDYIFGMDTNKMYEDAIVSGIEMVSEYPQYNLDLEILGKLEIPSANLGVKIFIYHNHFKDGKSTIEMSYYKLDTGRYDYTIYNNYHPVYLLDRWNKDKNKRLKSVRLMDTFVNETIIKYLEKLKLQPELNNLFEKYEPIPIKYEKNIRSNSKN